MIAVTDTLEIDEAEIEIRAARATGPGGQHVNKTSTAIELRFHVRNSPSLPEAVKSRLIRLAGSKMTLEGELLLFAQNHRSQAMNRQDAIDRLTGLIAQAAVAPKRRRPTRPTKASKERRLSAKTRRGALKARRTRPPPE